MTGSFQKIFHPSPRIGFLAHARLLSEQIAAGAVAPENIAVTERLIFNDRLDAVVTAVFVVLVVTILAESARHWWGYWTGSREPVLQEAPMQVSKYAQPEPL